MIFLTLKDKRLLICLLLITISLTVRSQTIGYVPDEILIKWKDKIEKQSTSRKAKKIGLKGKKLKEINGNVEVWRLQAGEKDITALIKEYKSHPDIELIEPNFIYHSFEIIPNDPLFSEQWGLKNTGQINTTTNGDIEATNAWELYNYSNSVKVAINDSGVDWKHPDLVDNIWQNIGEDANGDGVVLIWNGSEWIFDPADENGIDDDGNGYIDDFIGWDFRDNDNNPFDEDGHGTHIAGIVGAKGNNGLGISGVTWDVQLVPLRILHRGNLKVSDAVAAIKYAKLMNIPVSNNSWGGENYSIILQDAIQDIAANEHLFITAAGNDSLNTDLTPIYPASFGLDNILNVAASDTIDNSASFKIGSSNFGQNSVDLYAPGFRIQSCLPNGTYGARSGTSMAAPYVTGTYALLKEIFPDKSYLDLKNDILNAVDPIPALNEKCVSGGRLNLYNALSQSGLNCAYRDSLALVALYDSTNGANWTNTWDLNTPISTWYGVTTNNDGCVISVDLEHNNLVGTIPDRIRNLNSIDSLIISYNQLHGIIPSSIDRLRNLRHLELNNNELEGPIPSTIGNLEKLQILYLNNNLLAGSIPLTIGNLENLIYLQFNNNQLEGHIPNIFDNLSGLKRLLLNNNQLIGVFPYSFRKLTSLEWLFVNDNQLIGRPFYIENFSKLTKIYLHNNQFSGPLPSIGQIATLQEVNFENNQFIGCFPQQFSSLCNINYNFSNNTGLPDDGNFLEFCNNRIGECASCSRAQDSLVLVDLYNSTEGSQWKYSWDLDSPIETWFGIYTNSDGCVKSILLPNNELVGTLPLTIGNLVNLELLELSGNELGGEIPASIGNLKKLSNLLLGVNQLVGPIPSQITELTGLNRLELHNNQLIGSIPSAIGQLKGVRVLNLSINKLDGEIPSTIGGLLSLRRLHLNRNELAGPIPIDIFKIATLEQLYLNNNELIDTISSAIGNLINLRTLSLENNQLNGAIPKEIGSLTSLTHLYLDNNKLTGILPAELGNLNNIQILEVAKNELIGNIPVAISNCVNLYQLSLSDNQLTGQIHPSIVNLLNLHILELNDNELSGCIPKSFLTLCQRGVSVKLHNNPSLPNNANSFCTDPSVFCADPIYPGDFNNDGIANKEDVLYWALAYPNNIGLQRPNATTDWYGQEAPNWGVTVQDIDSKHQDADGNGIINEADLEVLKINYGKTHGYRPFSEITNGISYELTTNNIIGDTVKFSLKLNGDNGPTNIHGISASIYFGDLEIDTLLRDFSNSALNPSHQCKWRITCRKWRCHVQYLFFTCF